MQIIVRFELSLVICLCLALLVASTSTSWGGYLNNGDGTITDTTTGLIWQQSDDGQTRIWQSALAYCEALNLAGKNDWRLPDIREFQFLVDEGRANPAIDPAFSCNNSNYWSGSTNAGIPEHAWHIAFDGGRAVFDTKASSLYVRCVRGGAFVSVFNSAKEPLSNLITLPLNGQLKNLRQTPVDLDKSTVVITHGWNMHPTNQLPEWIYDMSQAMMDPSKDPIIDSNILWWDWLEQATSPTPAPSGLAASNAPRQGEALAKTLLTVFGQSYNMPIHFIGHSMGTRVNRKAANYLHSHGWDSRKTHVTILDAAEFGDLDLNLWDKCIPDNAIWIDNYVTAFGDLHSEASNVILMQGMPITVEPTLLGLFNSFAFFHHYAVDWYILSIKNPSLSQMGFRWSFEGGGLNGSPGVGTTFVQTSSASDNALYLDNITWNDADSIIVDRNMLLTTNTDRLITELIIRPIEEKGDVIAGISINSLIKFSLNLILTESSPSYAWVPIYIPPNAEFMSFEFKAEQPGDGDYFSVGIQNELLFMLDIDNLNVLQKGNSGYLNISEYAGTEVELFFALNNVGSPNAKISIENIYFYSRLFGDTEKDGDVDGTDLAAMIQSFGSVAGQANYHALKDLNGDGVVDQYDIPKFSEKFGHVN